MNTTNYVLELLISGVSTFIWLILLFLIIIGQDIIFVINFLDETDKLIIALATLPVIYTFGVLVDRLVDIIFDKADKKIRRKENFETEEQYRKSRSNIYIHSESLINLFEYGRIRIRICRNWVFNGLLIFLTSMIYIWTFPFINLEYLLKWKFTLAVSLILLSSVVLAYFSWKQLNIKQYRFLKIQNEIFEKK